MDSPALPPSLPARAPVQAPSALTAAPEAASQRLSEEHLRESLGTPAQTPLSFAWGGYFQAIGILILLLAGLWLALRLVRRFGGGRFLPAASPLPRQALRLEAQLPLGQHKSIVVVRFLNKRLALGVTDRQITFLTEAEVQGVEIYPANFQTVMEKAREQANSDPACQPVDGPPAARPPAADHGPGR
jgi:flagellar biosynthetic protein FliO